MTEPASSIRAALDSAEVVAFPGGGGGGDGRLNRELAAHELNDVGNAQRFIGRFGGDMLFVQQIGWHVWTGTHYSAAGGEDRVRIWAHQTAAAILEECDAVLKDDAAPWGGEADRRQRVDALFGWAKECGNRRRIEAMISEARPYLSVTVEQLDADPDVVNLENGTLRIEGACAELAPHRRADRLAKVMPVALDPNATCPAFDAFLDRVQPDVEVRGFLQRWAGYCLTGRTGEQCLVFNWGLGANGKSTFVELLGRIMGPYAAVLQFSSLSGEAQKGGERASPDLARLPGVRGVRASEPDRGDALNEARVKWITGSEAITARALHKGYVDFVPQFKVTMLGNHRPEIKGQDDGIWRRVRLVPWTVQIPPEERDQRLGEALWAERAGVLNWMLDGARLWLERGLAPPRAVLAATEQYRADSDALGRFIKACVKPQPGVFVTGRAMFEAYEKWCAANAERPWKMTSFGKAMGSERGFEKDRSSGVVQYLNVQLVNVPEVDLPWRRAADGPPAGHPAAFGEGD